MKRHTGKPGDVLGAGIRQEASRCDLTASDGTPGAIAAHLPNEGGHSRIRRSFRSAGSGDSGRTDIAERMEEILAGLAEGDHVPDEGGTEGRSRKQSG